MSRRPNTQPMVRAGQAVNTTDAGNTEAMSAEEIEARQREQAAVLEKANADAAASGEQFVADTEAARQAATEAQQETADEMFTLSGSDLEKIIEERLAEAMRNARATSPSPAAVSQVVTEEMQRAGQPLGFGTQMVTTEVRRSRETGPNGTVTEVYEGGKRVGVVLANGEQPPAPRIIDDEANSGEGTNDEE